jgi:DNA-binding GntR family transcriptional regulator
MSPAHVLQPTYERLKRELMQGVWEQNVRLEAARIADDYGVSATPVRDSLNLLVGEGLITFRPGEGYRTKVITERDLAELLSINLVLLHVAIDTATAGPRSHDLQSFQQISPYAEAVGSLFQDMALASGNRVLAGIVERLSDRLHHVRMKEHLVFTDLTAELAALGETCSLRPAAAKDELAVYHERRLRMARRLVAFLP